MGWELTYKRPGGPRGSARTAARSDVDATAWARVLPAAWCHRLGPRSARRPMPPPRPRSARLR